MFVVATGSTITVAMGTELSRLPIGSDTVFGAGVGDCAEATPLMSNEQVTASASPASAFRPSRSDEHDRFFAKVEKTGVDGICIFGFSEWILRIVGSLQFAATGGIGCTFFHIFQKKARHFMTAFCLRCAANLEEDSSCARSLGFDRARVAHRRHISFKSKTGSFIFTVTSARTFGTKTQAMG